MENNQKYIFLKDNNSIIFDDIKLFEDLRITHRICAEPIGTLMTNSTQNDVQGPPFTLNQF